MFRFNIWFVLCVICVVFNLDPIRGQRAPPGVPPQHYQQQQQQYQAPPVAQHHQVPVQPIQHNIPQNPNAGSAGGHRPPNAPPPQQYGHPQPPGGHPHPPQHGFQQPHVFADDINQERSHVKEHMDVPLDTSSMSEAELQFHYFKMHDANNDTKLDGNELCKSLIHWHESGNHDVEPKIFNDEELMNLIDPILKSDDANNDGCIDFLEFNTAQQRAKVNAKH